MLQLTITSVISMILFSLCFALLLTLIIKSDWILSRVKYELLLLFMLAPIIKIIIPIEILPWTQNVDVPYLLPEVVSLANRKFVTIGTNTITVWNIVTLFLVIGMLIALVKTVAGYVFFRRYVDTLPKVDNPTIYQVMEKILTEKGKKVSIELKWTNPEVSASIGGAWKPYILIPKTEMSNQEIESILRHELAHYLHGDLVIRMGWCVIKIVCWWNPAVYILDRQFEKLLEIRADKNAIKNTNKDVDSGYMEALVNISRENKIADKGSKFCSSFQEDYGISPKRRINLMLAKENLSKNSVVVSNVIIISAVVALTVMMNVFIFEPVMEIPEEDYVATKMVNNSEYFLVKNAEGTYDMYMDGVFCAVLEDSYGSDMPIYDTIEEALKNEGLE